SSAGERCRASFLPAACRGAPAVASHQPERFPWRRTGRALTGAGRRIHRSPDRTPRALRCLALLAPAHDKDFIVEPESTMLLQHLVRCPQVLAAGDDRLETLILDLIHVDSGIPRGKQ